MEVKFIADESLDKFEVALKSIESNAKSILILSCDENNYDNERLNSIISKCSKPILGGVFPQIIFDEQNHTKGAIIAAIDDTLHIHTIENISSDDIDMDELIEESIGELNDEVSTMFVFVDGLAKNINNLILSLFDNFGLTINYVGGGSGSLTFVQKPSIYTNEGLKQDCAILATSKLKSSIGVKHGWKTISDEMQVTSSNGNEVIELNYKPAFEVYKKIVENISGQKFNDDNFFDIAKGYPLGINKLSGEAVVRDPITTDGKSLICVGDVLENSFITILKGENELLIDATATASQEAKMENNHFTLFIDCISRVLFLEDNFQEEIKAVGQDKNSLIGALTLGEIANNKKHYLEFYNKTSVVANIES
jgi:hypothetical protein